MKIGDLVKRRFDNELGIVLWQVGDVDRWVVYWITSGYKQGYNASGLEVVCE